MHDSTYLSISKAYRSVCESAKPVRPPAYDDYVNGDGRLHVFVMPDDWPLNDGKYIVIMPTGEQFDFGRLPWGWGHVYVGDTSYSTRGEMEDALAATWDGVEYTPSEVEDLASLDRRLSREIAALADEVDGERGEKENGEAVRSALAVSEGGGSGAANGIASANDRR